MRADPAVGAQPDAIADDCRRADAAARADLRPRADHRKRPDLRTGIDRASGATTAEGCTPGVTGGSGWNSAATAPRRHRARRNDGGDRGRRHALRHVGMHDHRAGPRLGQRRCDISGCRGSSPRSGPRRLQRRHACQHQAIAPALRPAPHAATAARLCGPLRRKKRGSPATGGQSICCTRLPLTVCCGLLPGRRLGWRLGRRWQPAAPAGGCRSLGRVQTSPARRRRAGSPPTPAPCSRSPPPRASCRSRWWCPRICARFSTRLMPRLIATCWVTISTRDRSAPSRTGWLPG